MDTGDFRFKHFELSVFEDRVSFTAQNQSTYLHSTNYRIKKINRVKSREKEIEEENMQVFSRLSFFNRMN